MRPEWHELDRTLPGFVSLLERLGLSVVDDGVRLPFDLGADPRTIELAAIGWATVELDRAVAELGARLATTFEPAARDGLLGATVRQSPDQEPPILIEEPDTEGRLAGALAQHGEGPIVLYLGVPHFAAVSSTLSTRAGRGPLGPARLLVNGPPRGPFLILVESQKRTEQRSAPDQRSASAQRSSVGHQAEPNTDRVPSEP